MGLCVPELEEALRITEYQYRKGKASLVGVGDYYYLVVVGAKVRDKRCGAAASVSLGRGWGIVREVRKKIGQRPICTLLGFPVYFNGFFNEF